MPTRNTPTTPALALLAASVICSLACAGLNRGRPVDAGPDPMCGTDGRTIAGLAESTRGALEEACQPDESPNQCDSVPCRTTMTYATQHVSLDDWLGQNPDTTPIAMYDAYIDVFVRPILDAHDARWSAQAILPAREVLAPAPEILRNEGKSYAEAFLRRMRERVKKVENDDERALLIEGYTNLKLLHALAMTPRGQIEPWRTDVRAKLEAHERIKAKLEILELDPPSKSEFVPSAPTTEDPAPPAPRDDAPPPPPPE